jgi:sulfate adenylyltransferase subunit 2
MSLSLIESESIEIIREAVATARTPVMMYSIGKDSKVMLHLARKAFHPAPPPFPLLHVDTGWKFNDKYAHRARMVAETGMRLVTQSNPDGLAIGVGPFTHGSNNTPM